MFCTCPRHAGSVLYRYLYKTERAPICSIPKSQRKHHAHDSVWSKDGADGTFLANRSLFSFLLKHRYTMAASSLQSIPTEHINNHDCNASPITPSQSISIPVPMAAFSHDMFTVVNNVITSVDFDKLDDGASTVTAAEIFRVSANISICCMCHLKLTLSVNDSYLFNRKRITGTTIIFSRKLARPMLLSLVSSSV